MTLPNVQGTHPRQRRRKLQVGMLLGSLCVVVACLAARYYWGGERASAGPVKSSKTPSGRRSATPQSPPRQSVPKIVARVNGEDITANQLAQECLRHYGNEVLERLVNKYLIMQECKAQGVTVAQHEVNAEIRRMATRFGIPVDQWLKMFKDERGIDPAQYANDIIWPTLALQKLAGEKLQVTEEEVKQQYEAQYGPAVKARLIVCDSVRKAEEVHAQAVADPDNFGNLAKNESVDTGSASVKGLINPIRKHVGHKEIEQVAFQMEEGEISPVIQVSNQYAILKCEGRLLPRNIPFEQAKPLMEETIRDGKLKVAAQEIFRKLQEQAQIVNILNNPDEGRKTPGVAAVINGHRVSVRELAELCMERHGEEVLEGTINRRLLEQACEKRNITITEADLDEEIRRAAAISVRPRPDGTPDVEAHLKLVTEQQGVSEEIHRIDAVWPSVALKKLVGDTVEVTEEDYKRGFEANYGPRVRCLAIVLDNPRRAQTVWEMARSNPSPQYFGDLAEEYSSDPLSRSLRGEVPPVQKHGGQPVLEREAFLLTPGELSSILQVDNHYVILLCQGRTEPTPVEFNEVRPYIYEDIHEKKLRIAMAKYFRKLQDGATIDNYLTGTTRSPKGSPAVKPAGS